MPVLKTNKRAFNPMQNRQNYILVARIYVCMLFLPQYVCMLFLPQ